MPRVYAKEMGIHPVRHGRVRKGEVFEVPDGVTDSWFAPVVAEEVVPEASAAKAGKGKGKVASVPVPLPEPTTLRDLQAQEPGLDTIA